jgi:catechol 2,3-dioxygenase-like lactoylglutathione lyase family enzyme
LKLERLLRVSLTVADLPAALAFYQGALGFTAAAVEDCDPALARLMGANGVRTVRIARGVQAMELAVFDPPGAPYPAVRHSNDLWFQHCALTTADIGTAYARLHGFAFTPISVAGPQRLPARAGGVTAFKFRDPEGHPLELIQFPDRPGAGDGIDHSAIAVAEAGRSVAYYEGLGLSVGSRSLNHGAEQDLLDGLAGVQVDVVGMMPPVPAPHVELLGYRTPPGRPGPVLRPADIAASRLVFAASGLASQPGAVALRDGGWAALQHDLDGHALLLLERLCE